MLDNYCQFLGCIECLSLNGWCSHKDLSDNWYGGMFVSWGHIFGQEHGSAWMYTTYNWVHVSFMDRNWMLFSVFYLCWGSRISCL